MNDLNSVLIEGTLTHDPTLTHAAGVARSKFRIESIRSIASPDGAVEERSIFAIVTVGHQAEVVYEQLKKGRGVRVVGHLKQGTNSLEPSHKCVYIHAEHVEFKPAHKGRPLPTPA